MNKNIIIKTFVISFVFMTIACSSKDEETLISGNTSFKFVATLESKNDARTRSLTETSNSLTATWVNGERIAIIYNNNKYSATIQSVTDGKATISATINDAVDGSSVQLIYPEDAVEYGATEISDYYTKFQTGDLADLSRDFDICIGNGILYVEGNTATLKNNVKMEEQNVICKFNFTDGTSDITDIKSLHIFNSNGDAEVMIDNTSNRNNFYVAIKPTQEKKTFLRNNNRWQFLYRYIYGINNSW